MATQYYWDPEKNELLQAERDISFEQIVEAIYDDQILDVIANPNQDKYPGQDWLIVRVEQPNQDYVYVVPCQKDGDRVKLITIYPSRKMTKKYLR